LKNFLRILPLPQKKYGEEESSVTVLRTQSQQRAPHEENAARNNTNDINVLRSCRWRS